MNDHIDRMEAEHGSLSDNIDKATKFIASSPIFETLASDDRRLLIAQRDAMVTYRSILALRLDRAKQLALPL